tara:strand:- start:910 stop:2535 length:1626 start_codon:yes stop_codon:yes gene_type:complete
MMSEMKPLVSSGRRFSAVWIIPLVALAIGISMAIHAMMTDGPTITIDFETAEGLKAGKTKVQLLNVEIGIVESVTLKENIAGVTVSLKLDHKTRQLLREDTRFWVVRARVGAGGVSGLSTILAGAYIEIAPGTGKEGKRTFVGLEEPPLTPLDAPGRRLTLHSSKIGSLSVGESVVYQGYKVGRIESMMFDQDQAQMRYDIFVDAPFHELINSNTRFWNSSGISLNASAEGFEVRMGSMDTLLLGGVAFGPPPGKPSGKPIKNGKEYKLYESYEDILKNPYRYGVYYVVSFLQSTRGLEPGAPVEYRGIPVGRVERILLKEISRLDMSDEGREAGRAIPVLIYLEPGRIELPDTQEAVTVLRQSIEDGVSQGLRATLLMGNLLTGKQLIGIDFYPDEAPAELGVFGQYPVIPSIETGIVRLETKVSKFLDRLNALPLDETIAGVNRVLGNADTTITSLNVLLESDDTKALPSELVTTLEELRVTLAGFSPDSKMYQGLGSSVNTLNGTLENLDGLIRQLSIRPNALLFPASPELDPIPEAR